MEKIKIKIEKGSVQETMMPQLYAKCYAMKKWPGCFFDFDCIQIKNRLDYDFSALSSKRSAFSIEIGALSAACRQLAIAAEIRDYLKTYPKAQIVLLGCGLDTVGNQADNGQCSFVNMDHPEVMEIRKKVIPCNERERNISADIRDTKWFDKLGYRPERGAVFAASGVFLYWSKKEARDFIRALSVRFPNGRLVFDAQNKRGAAAAQKALLKAGIHARVRFYMDDPKKELSKWDIKHKKISCKKMVSDYRTLNGKFSFTARLAAAYSDVSGAAQINIIDF